MKTCSKCELKKEDSEFNKHRNGLGSYCKVCLKEYHNKRNCTKEQREFRKERNRVYKEKIQQNIIDYLKANPCSECGEDDIVVLEFDHLRDKKFCIADAINRGYIWTTVEKEIAKCRVLCANCHRRHTAKSRGWFKTL